MGLNLTVFVVSDLITIIIREKKIMLEGEGTNIQHAYCQLHDT